MTLNTEVLQKLSQATYGLDYPGGMKRATGLDLDPNGISLLLWGKELYEAEVEAQALLSSHALLLPGTSGSFISTPDAVALDIVGDIDMAVEFVTTAGAVNQVYISKWNETGAQRSYQGRVTLFTTLHLDTSTNGTAVLEPFTFSAVNPGALRWTLDVDLGGTQKVHSWFFGPSLDGPWTQIDVQTTAGITSIFNSTAALILGANNAGTGGMFKGRITRAYVKAGINGTLVANPDFRNLAPGTTSFTDSTGKLWTLAGNARIV